MPVDEPLVCIAHGRHLPCRKDGPHLETSSAEWVWRVQNYHRTDHDWNWWPSYLFHMEGLTQPSIPLSGDVLLTWD